MATNNKPPVGGIYNQVNISVLDIDKPDILKELYQTRGDQWQSDFYKMMQLIGLERPVSQPAFSHYEDDDFERVARIGTGGVAAAAGASHAAITVPLSTNDVFTNELGSKSIFPQIGDVWQFPNKAGNSNIDLQGLVTAISPASMPPTMTIKLLNSTDTTDTGYLEGDVMVKEASAFSPGTDQPQGTLRNFRKRTMRTQIFKATQKMDGSEGTNGKWFTEVASTGESIVKFWNYAQQQMDYTHLANISTAMLFQQEVNDNGLIDPLPYASGNPVRTTKGVKPWILDGGGHSETYPIGGFSVTKYDRMSQIFEEERAGGTGVWLYAFNQGVEMENELVNYNKDTNITYNFGDRADRVVAVGFKQITKAERTFMFKKIGALSDPNRMGAYTEKKNQAFILPLDNRMVYSDMNKSDGRSQPTLLLRYKENAGYSRRNETFVINGTGLTNSQRIISTIDQDAINTRCEIGFQPIAVNQFIHLQGV